MLQREEDPPKLHVVLLGLDRLMPDINDRVKREQLAHLIELAQRPNMTIQLLLPGSERATSQGLTEQELSSDLGIVRFADPADPPGSYSEDRMSADPFGGTLARFKDDPGIVAGLKDRFETIAAAALPQDVSLERLLVARHLLAPSGKAAPAPPRRKPDAAGRRGVGGHLVLRVNR